MTKLASDKGYSEETCVRCGWKMGDPPLNCQNDDTPHRFPSQDALGAVRDAVPRPGRLRWLAALLDAMDERGWPEGLTHTLPDGRAVVLLEHPNLDTPRDAVQRDLRALADALEASL